MRLSPKREEELRYPLSLEELGTRTFVSPDVVRELFEEIDALRAENEKLKDDEFFNRG